MTIGELVTYPAGEPERLEPDPLHAKLRAQPMIRVQLPYGEPAWLATRYEDVKLIMGDPRFSRQIAAEHDEPRVRPIAPPPGNIMSLDPPEHTRVRRPVTRALTVRRIEELRPRVEEIANGLVDAMLAKGSPADLVESFGLPLPIAVICEVLGVPFEDRTNFRVWSEAFLSSTKYTEEEVGRHVGSLYQYLTDMIERRRQAPTDDLMGTFVSMCDDGELTEQELLILALAVLVAGHETTATQIPNFVYVLLHNPDQLDLLRSDLELIPKAVEELTRYVPLGYGGAIARYALEDVEMGGVTVRAGEAVVPELPAANRDESVFPQPDRLDILREQSVSHLGWGHGAHHCIGAALGRMELQVALDVLLRRLPGLRLADGENGIEWKTGGSTRGPSKMLVAWAGDLGH